MLLKVGRAFENVHAENTHVLCLLIALRGYSVVCTCHAQVDSKAGTERLIKLQIIHHL
jgi:hypothetical protein